MKKFGLNKQDKLCSKTAINTLFNNVKTTKGDDGKIFTTIAYPLRAVWCESKISAGDAHIKFLISVPKKRLKKAVDRVKMRRRIREAYRLNHHSIDLKDNYIDLAFIYISDSLQDYNSVEKSMSRILAKIENSFAINE